MHIIHALIDWMEDVPIGLVFFSPLAATSAKRKRVVAMGTIAEDLSAVRSARFPPSVKNAPSKGNVSKVAK